MSEKGPKPHSPGDKPQDLGPEAEGSQTEKETFSLEKVKKLREVRNQIIDFVGSRNWREAEEVFRKIDYFHNQLLLAYKKKVRQYATYYILSEEIAFLEMPENRKEILYKDFPDYSSVSFFFEELMKQHLESKDLEMCKILMRQYKEL